MKYSFFNYIKPLKSRSPLLIATMTIVGLMSLSEITVATGADADFISNTVYDDIDDGEVESEIDDFNDDDFSDDSSIANTSNITETTSLSNGAIRLPDAEVVAIPTPYFAPQTSASYSQDNASNSTSTTTVNNAPQHTVPTPATPRPSTTTNPNIFERQKLQSSLDDNLLIKNVPLNAVSPETLSTFVQVIDLVRRDYVEPVSDEELFENAIAGMLEKLDSHAEFLDTEAYDNLRAFTEGDVGHVGLKVNFLPSASQWVISEVAPDSPAAQGGIHVGDYLHRINDIKLNAGMYESDIVQLLTGIAGTQVDVEVSSAGREKHLVTLQRNIAQRQQLEVEVIGSVVYVKLPVFQNDTAIQMIQALEALDTPITGVLIDLRNNPGGVLTSAIEVASLFMDDTDVVEIRGRRAPPKILSTQGDPLLRDLPVVILQNRYSASASEVLSSSLQINNRAIITGERSYGKGSIQAILPLNDDQAIKMTVAHYFGADGSEIDGRGVTPDVALPENNTSLWKQQAVSLLLEQDRPLGIIFSDSEDGLAIENSY